MFLWEVNFFETTSKIHGDERKKMLYQLFYH